MLQLSAISIYPVKSLGGIRLNQAVVTPRGLEHDRRFLVVDANGVFLTQRQLPLMVRLQTQIVGDQLQISSEKNTLLVPLSPDGARVKVNIWGQEVEAISIGAPGAAFFSEALRMHCELVWMPEDCELKVDPNTAKNGEITSFSDGFPFLIFGENSLANLNKKMNEAVPANRFRANFEFSGGAAWEEDSWKRFRIGEVEFENVKLSARCVMTTIDQESGERRGAEPLKTLATFRKRGDGVMFGCNLVACMPGTVQIGDKIEVLERF